MQEKANPVDPQDLRQARIRAVILATAIMVTICSLFYARVQTDKVEKLQIKIDSLNAQLDAVNFRSR